MKFYRHLKNRLFSFLGKRTVGVRALVIQNNQILNPDGEQFKNEMVYHKILDAMGDFSLLGARIIGDFEAENAGHTLNHLLIQELCVTHGYSPFHGKA